MPIYEYKCSKCGKEYELFQRITEPAAKSCKFCKGRVNKLISQTTFHLKGSGWYVTDYGGTKAPPSEAKKEETTSSSESTETTTSSSADTGTAD